MHPAMHVCIYIQMRMCVCVCVYIHSLFLSSQSHPPFVLQHLHRIQIVRSSSGQRVVVGVRHVMLPGIAIMSTNIVVLTLFTFLSPLVYRRIVDIPGPVDDFGRYDILQ